MKKIVRNELGRFDGQDYLWNEEESECWKDHKVKPDTMRFPIHNDYYSSPVVTYHISQLKTN